MTREEAHHGSASAVVPVFFLSDSTGISAETMGNALLIQFPDLRFERTLIPFISSVEEARKVVEQAKGRLMAQQGITEAEAFRWIQRTAMNQRTSMKALAQSILEPDATPEGTTA